MELLERERCLADLMGWLRATGERGGCVVLIGGEAGIGKTALLQEFSGLQHGVRVLWGACDDLFTPRPLAPLHDIARQSGGALAAAVESAVNREEIFSAALQELRRVPTLAVFEDVHWADEATLDLLKYLGRRIAQTQALLAVSYRDTEVGSRHPLRFLLGDLPRATTQRMSLPPLSEAAVAQLAQRAGRPPQGIHGITSGNPLFVTEVLASGAATVPANVRDAVLARAVRLAPAARALAELVCVVPGKADASLVEQAARPQDADIEQCLALGMLRLEDGSFAYRHELIRRALEDSLSPRRRQELNAQVLAVLAARPETPAARLAHHARGACDTAAVLRFAPVAAEQAASMGAHREAAAHYDAAVRHADGASAAERARLHEQLSFELHVTGQHEGAIAARRAALELWRACGVELKQGDALRWLSRLSWYVGRHAEAHQFAAAAVGTLEVLPPGPELGMAYCNLAQLDMLAHSADAAIRWAQRAIDLAEPAAHSETLSHALSTLGTVRLTAWDPAGWADLERSLSLALVAGLQEHAARAYSNLAAMAVANWQYARAAGYLRDGLAYCEAHDLDSWRLYMLACRARARLEHGDWLGAGADAEAVLAHRLSTWITRIPALTVIGRLRSRRGDPAAGAPLEEALSLAGPSPELQRLGTLAAACAEHAWLAGDREGVVRAVQPAYDIARGRRDPAMKGELAAWLWRLNALDQPPADVPPAYALEMSGDWRGAAQAWSAAGRPYEQASVLACHGSEVAQREALAIFEQLGAGAAAQALRRRMRVIGVRKVPRGARSSTRRDPHGLTRREAQILSLMSAGLRNAAIAQRLFLSTRTVDHHVSAILTKLGARSRAEAVTIAHSRAARDG